MASGGVQVAFAHAMYLINLAAPDRTIFEKSVKAMAGEISRADSLGLPFVVIHPGAPKEKKPRPTLLADPLDSSDDFFRRLVSRFSRLGLLFEQADTKLTPARFFAISGGLAASGFFVPVVAGLSLLVPCIGSPASHFPLSFRSR